MKKQGKKAKFGSKEAGAKGGKARAKRLSKAERSEIARNAAVARWGKRGSDDLPRAICGGETPLKLGNVELPCFVLDDERRVITASEMQSALGMSGSGGSPRLVSFAMKITGKPSRSGNLPGRLESPIEFVPPHGGLAKGYEAILLADLCDAILGARKSGRLTDRYSTIAESAEVLVRGWARVGIIALIDEATGFEKFRKRLALAEILDKYLDDHLQIWTKTFSDEFYEHFFRLKGWDYTDLKAGNIKPAEVGKFTRDEVYRRLHPGIVRELEKNNPYVVPGRRLYKHHQWLTREIGHPALEKHIAIIIAIMKLSKNWIGFKSNLQTALPKASDTEYMDFIKDDATK